MSTTAAPRICFVTGNFYPIVGGGERHADLLSRELVRLGASVIVLTRRRFAHLARRELKDGYTILRVGPSGFARTGKYWMILPTLWRLWRLRDEYDVIYVCGLRVLGWAGVLAQGLTGKPCVLRAEARGELNGEFIWRSPEGKVDPVRRFIFRPLIGLRNLLFRRARAFLSISTPISEEFLDAGVAPEKMEVIPNGLDPDMFRPLPPEERATLRKNLGIPTGRVLAYSGKLNRGKGLELLLRVWARYVERRPDAHLLLIGSGGGQHLSCEEALRVFVKQHRLESSVTFCGYVDRVGDYINAADVFVFPSESESMGLAVLEAMACGVPVIASRIPGVMDMITDGETGILVEVKDETAWLAAMERTNPEDLAIRQCVEAAQHLVRDRFTIAAVAQRHIRFFQQI